MSNNIVLIGDLHAAVDDAPPPPAPQPEPGDAPAREPRAVVIVVDLRDTASKGDAKAALRRAAEVAVDAARGYAKVRHVVIAAKLNPAVTRSFDRLASAVATRFHSQLERALGRDIEFTLLDITDCTDAAVLLGRLRERADDPAGVHGVVVLNWDDIVRAPIAQAAREQYF